MRRQIKLSILLTITLSVCLIYVAKSQSSGKKTVYPNWKKRIDSVFMKSSGPYKFLIDSISIYSLNLSLKVSKDIKTQKTRVTNLSVSNDMIFKLFPAYKTLSSIDYSEAMGKRKNLNVIVSIIISNTSPNAKSKYGRKTDAVVDVESTTDNFQKSLFFISKNSKESEGAMVVFMPYIIRIADIP